MLLPGASWSSRKQSAAQGAAAESPQNKWLRDSLEALQKQRPVQSIKNIAKQSAAAKVALLKQRLEALKSLLQFASPETAKRLARELKNIAADLAAIAKSLSGRSGGANSGAGTSVARASDAQAPADSATEAPAGEVAASEVPASEADSAASAAATAAASASAVAGSAESGSGLAAAAHSADADADVDVDVESGDAPDGPARAGESADADAGLKALLRDARKLLKEVIDQLKAKLAHADRETKQDILEAEKSLAELDMVLNQQSEGALYSGNLGTAAMDTGIVAVVPGISGSLVDLSA